jgi:hypothetical protein
MKIWRAFLDIDHTAKYDVPILNREGFYEDFGGCGCLP